LNESETVGFGYMPAGGFSGLDIVIIVSGQKGLMWIAF